MAKNAMPVSKAKTAYGLLSEIRKLILEEPKRYDQTAWKREMSERDEEYRPACGTTCCIAGWVETLKSSRPVPAKIAHERENARTGINLVSDRAAKILGLTWGQRMDLFEAGAAGWNPLANINAHAANGAAHIAAFQARHADQLKAKKV